MLRTMIWSLLVGTVALTSQVLAQQSSPAPASENQAAVGVAMPANGATMSQVRQRFGPPESEQPPVGDPPITRWRYSGYTVYFERDLVITSVSDAELGLTSSP